MRCCGVALTLAAFTFDAAPLFVPGVAFTLLGALDAAVGVRPARAARPCERRLLEDRVVEGEPVEAMIEVRRGPLGLPGGEVLDPLAGTPVSLSRPLSLIAGGSKADVRVVARFARRGLRRLEPPCAGRARHARARERRRASATARAGAARAAAHRAGAMDRRASAAAARRARDARQSDEPLAAVDIDGLRPYRPGTPASRIHWAALARGAGLLERRLRADGDTPAADRARRARARGPEEHLDAAVRAAASLTLELARRGGCRVLLPGERRPITVESDLNSWPGVHTRLALVEGGADARAPALAPGARLGPVFYVAAKPIERLPAGADRRGQRRLRDRAADAARCSSRRRPASRSPAAAATRCAPEAPGPGRGGMRRAGSAQ